MAYYEYTTLDEDSENLTFLNLNEFTVTEFLEYVFPYFKKTKHFCELPKLKLTFFGDWEFGFLAQSNFIFILLKSKDSTMVNWLENFPGLISVSNFTYCYEMPSSQLRWRASRNANANRYEVEDFEIIRGLWDMHKGFRRIDMPEHKITFRRRFASPKRLTTLCRKLLEDSRLLGHLPEHVSNRLKINEDSHDESKPDGYATK